MHRGVCVHVCLCACMCARWGWVGWHFLYGSYGPSGFIVPSSFYICVYMHVYFRLCIYIHLYMYINGINSIYVVRIYTLIHI